MPRSKAILPAAHLSPPEVVIQHHGRTLFGPMKEWKMRKRIPSVLLITGQSGIGKKSMSSFLARWILCETTGLYPPSPLNSDALTSEADLRPCEECTSCRKILSGNDVDFTEISSELEEGLEGASKTLKIEQFRKLKSTVGFGPHSSRHKIVLISNADRMTLQAANSVLKLLEETPPGWIFFLTASDASLLLPTIVSRCQMIRLKPFSPTEIQELLNLSGADPKRVKICAELSQGSWSRALSFSEDGVWENRRTLFQFIKEPAATLQILIDWISQDPHHFDLLIDLLEQLTADLVKWSTSDSPLTARSYFWLNADGQEELSFHAQQLTQQLGSITAARKFWIAQIERLAQVRQDSFTSANRKLLIQNILLGWMAAEA